MAGTDETIVIIRSLVKQHTGSKRELLTLLEAEAEKWSDELNELEDEDEDDAVYPYG